MNERIRELAEKSHLMGYMVHLYTVDAPAGYRVPLDNRKEAIEKFAELIVKEMCDMMEQTEDDAYSLEPSERPTEYIQFLYDWRTRFEQHFGVEE